MKRLTLAGVILLLSIVSVYADDYARYYVNMPVEIPHAAPPVIPDNSVNIKDFGGKGDGMTLNTDAFQKAISALEKKGGGRVVVPAGIWMTGLISLKDNIDLHLSLIHI